jgi:hypothetical protein
MTDDLRFVCTERYSMGFTDTRFLAASSDACTTQSISTARIIREDIAWRMWAAMKDQWCMGLHTEFHKILTPWRPSSLCSWMM